MRDLDPALLVFFNESFFTLPPKKNKLISNTSKSMSSTLQDFEDVLRRVFPNLNQHINNLRFLNFESLESGAFPTDDDKEKFFAKTLPETIPSMIALLESRDISIEKSEPEIQDFLENGLKKDVCYAGKLVNIENLAKKLDACFNLQSKFMIAREQTIRDLLIKKLGNNPGMEIHYVSEILYTYQAHWGIQATYDPRSGIYSNTNVTATIAESSKIQVRSLLPSGVLFNLTHDIAESPPHLIFDLLTATYGPDSYYTNAGVLLDHSYYYDERHLPVRSWAAEHYLFLSIYYRLITKGYCKNLYRTDELTSGMTITYLPSSENVDNSLAFCHVTTADKQRIPLIVYAVDALFENNQKAITSIDSFLQKNAYSIRNFSQLLEEKESDLIAAFSQIENDSEKDYSKINYTLLDQKITQNQNEFWKIFVKKIDIIEMDEMQMTSIFNRISYEKLQEVILSTNSFKNTIFCALLHVAKGCAQAYVERCITNADTGAVASIIDTVKNKNIKILEKIFKENILNRQSEGGIITKLQTNGMPTPAIKPLKIDNITSLKNAKLLFIYGAPVDIDDSKTMRCIHWMHVCNDPEVTVELSTEEHSLFFTRYLQLFENALEKENHIQIQTFLQDEKIVAHMLSKENFLKQARPYFEKNGAREDSLICLVETMITSAYAAYTTAQRKEYEKLIENIKEQSPLEKKILQYANEISENCLSELADEVISRIKNDQCSPVLRKFSTALLRNNLQSRKSRKLLKELCNNIKNGKDLYKAIKTAASTLRSSKSVLDMCCSFLKKDDYSPRQKDTASALLYFNPAIMFLLKKQSISYDIVSRNQIFFEEFLLENSFFDIIEFSFSHGGMRDFSLNVIAQSAIFKNFLDHIKKNTNSILISNLDLESVRENLLNHVDILTLALQQNKISPLSVEEIVKICENPRISEAEIEELMKQIDQKIFHRFIYNEIIKLTPITNAQKKMAKYIDIDTFTLSSGSETVLKYALQTEHELLVKQLFKFIPHKYNEKNLLLANAIFSTTPKNELTPLFNRCYASSIFETLKTKQYNLLEKCIDKIDEIEPGLCACTKVFDVLFSCSIENIEEARELFARYCNNNFSKYKNKIEKIFAGKDQGFIRALMRDALSRKIEENVLALFRSHYFDVVLFRSIYSDHKEYIRSLIPHCNRIARGHILMHAYANQDGDTIDELLNNSRITDQPSFELIKTQLDALKLFSPSSLNRRTLFKQQFDTAVKARNIKMIKQMIDMGMIVFFNNFDNDNDTLVAALEYSVPIIQDFEIIEKLDDIANQMTYVVIGNEIVRKKELIKIAINLNAENALEMLIRPLRGDCMAPTHMMFTPQEWCGLKLRLADPADAQMLRPSELSTLEKDLEEYIETRQKESDSWWMHWTFNICGLVYHFGHSKAVKIEAANWLLTILAAKQPAELSPEATAALQQKNSTLGNLYRKKICWYNTDFYYHLRTINPKLHYASY